MILSIIWIYAIFISTIYRNLVSHTNNFIEKSNWLNNWNTYRILTGYRLND